MSKDKNQKDGVPRVTHVRIGSSKKKKTKSFIDFAVEYAKNSKKQSQIVEQSADSQADTSINLKQNDTKPSDIITAKTGVAQDRADTTGAIDVEVGSAFAIPLNAQKKPAETRTIRQESAATTAQPADQQSESSEDTSMRLSKEGPAAFFPRFLRQRESGADTSTQKMLQIDRDLDTEDTQEPIKLLTSSEQPVHSSARNRQTTNLNSFSSIFNRDSASIAGVRRVFKKSLTMMVLSFLSFALLSFISLRLLSINLIWVVVLQVAFVTITNIFYIIVADRSYVLIGLGLQALIFLTAHSFLGQGFSVFTLAVLGVVILLIYLGYSEVEKTQLSSRLFSINHITAESVRMLNTASTLVLAIGMFNNILAVGSENFLRDQVFENQFLTDYIIIGDVLPGLNRIFLDNVEQFKNADQTIKLAKLQEEDPESNLNFYTFLYHNYGLKGEGAILSDREASDLRLDSTVNFKQEVERITRERAEGFRQEVYKRLPYNLDTILTREKFKKVVEETYVYLVNKFEAGSNNSLSEILSIPMIPRNYILPGGLAIVVFTLSLAANYVLRYVISVVTGLVWFVLRKLDFARIDIENVEAEVVTI